MDENSVSPRTDGDPGPSPEEPLTEVAPAAPLPPAPRPVGSRPRGWMVVVVSVVAAVVAGGVAGAVVSRSISPATASYSSPSMSVTGSNAQEPAVAAAAVAIPSVVNIDVQDASGSMSGLPAGHPVVPSGGTGSGVAFRTAPGGGTYVITNNHVVSGARTIVVTPSSGEALDATLVGTDPQTDIAVVKVSKRLPIIRIGDSETLVVGQMVLAIGSPFGLQQSVSQGIVSAVHRAVTGTDGGPSDANPLVDAIQTDAAINPGNSGGALVDRTGALVGIDSAIFSDTGQNAGIGFAIPVKTAVSVADQLISTGKVQHPFIGVAGSTVDATVAGQDHLPVEQGALIEQVYSGTGAAKAGLKAGDVVVSVDGEAVRTMNDLILDVRREAVGATVTIGYYRGGSKRSAGVVVGNEPASLN